MEILPFLGTIIQKQSVTKNIILGQFQLKRDQKYIRTIQITKNILSEKYFALLPENDYGSVLLHLSS